MGFSMTSDYQGSMPALPQELLESGVVLANEIAWPANQAITVIEYLSHNKLAIVGAELWEAVEGRPKWIASSNYRCDEQVNIERYVSCCADGARQFVRRWEYEAGALFNLTWIDPN
jgi:hypothetical protein